ncbi:MAG: aminoacyl-histidine dipeptidase [Bacteroidales bacterium]|nr:aminoacyl-histidine dipeptidase [Bacteroidales bacterium]
MNENILDLEPKALWRNFRELTLIPRPSKHEEAVTKFLLDFGKKHCDEAFIDKTGNVIYRKKASSIEMSNRKSILLQAHCDMVPQKDDSSSHNFLTDPIETIVSGGFVSANHTTLGGDDGIGVAAIMAIMEDKTLKHGPLEALITIDEETGMTGANGLEPNIFESTIMLNLDSEEDNIFYIGCAGGVNVHIEKSITHAPTPSGYSAYNVNFEGFLGGHSGCDIHKNRPNAIKLMFRMLWEAKENFDIKICHVEGGNMRNAIPRTSKAVILVKNQNSEAFESFANDFNINVIKQEYGKSDPDGKVTVSKTDAPAECLSDESAKDVLFLGNNLISGVFAMSADMPGLVESSNNLAIVNIENGKMLMDNLLRSSSATQSKYLCNIIRCMTNYCGAEVSFSGEYPGWQPNPKSEIVDLMIGVYKNLFGSKPEVTAIHAGLECGIIIGNYPDMDAVSIGPNTFNVHTPTEKIEIASTQRFMKLLCETIENAPVVGGVWA